MPQNSFAPAERKYPVEMPFLTENTYTLNMEIPEGYEVTELPKSVRFAFNENQGTFEYLIQQNSTGIQMRSRLRLNKTIFPPEEYPSLRDFFEQIAKKQREQIVFRRK